MDDIGNPTDSPKKDRIPLGVLRQAVMKLDSAMGDIREAREDDDLDENEKYALEGSSELIGQVMAIIVNIVNQEMEEDDFIAEQIDMDDIDNYPGLESDEDLLDQEI